MKKQFAGVFLPLVTSVLAAFGAVGLATDGAPTRVPGCDPDLVYCPTGVQERVDRSFSNIKIDTPLARVEGQLTEVRAECFPGECDWQDRNGVRHYFFGDKLVVKAARAEEFVGRAMDALGIGMSRDQAEVVDKVELFLGDVELECRRSQTLANECHASLDPGWIWISFDGNGKLIEAHFDGYHFT